MGKAVGYLILLTFLLSVAVFVPVYQLTYEKSSEALSYITDSMPDFRFSEGRLEVYGEMPIVIEDNDLPVVIDTNPGAEDRIIGQYDIVLLFTDDKLVMKNYVNRQEYPLSAFEGIDVTKDKLMESMPMIEAYMNIMFIITGIFISIFFVAGKFLSALAVSVIGLIANSSYRINMSYKNIFKLSIFSMTLPLVVCTIADALMINIPFQTLLFYIGSGIYIFGAMNRIKRNLEAAGVRHENNGIDN
jgi:hypothetical protein